MQGCPAALLILLAGSGYAADYIGSKACARCHVKLYEAYIRTPMGRSLHNANAYLDLASTRAVVISQELQRKFEVWTDQGHMYQSETGKDFRQVFPIAYAIGSGVNGIGFVVRRGDYLFEAPLSYYTHPRAWGLSPGYDHVDSGFNRPIATGCIACHTGRAQPVPGSNGKYLEPPLLELAVGCENCHGPGARHVAAGGARSAIVNPARLKADLMQDVCMFCHQAGDARVLKPGKTLLDFRPGTPLDDTAAIFKIPRLLSTGADLLEHHESMRLSRCFRESGKMTCLTCHDPHASTTDYRAKCLACHRKELPAPHPAGNGGCTGCHMPKRDIATIAHSALTNHRIPRRGDDPAASASVTTGAPGNLIHVNGRPDRPLPLITLLQAYGQLMDQRPEYRQRFNDLLDRASEAQDDDPVVLAMLGRRALRSNSFEEAIRYLTRSIERGSISFEVFEDLGEALARAGRPEDALGVLRRGIQLSPFTPELYKSAALRHVALGRRDDALKMLNIYLGLFPQDDFIRELLTRLSRR